MGRCARYDHVEEGTCNPASKRSREESATKPSENPESKTRKKTENMSAVAHLESDDYFEVLGLTRSATEGDVKKAYRKLAVQWHPDKNRSHPKAEEYFKNISEAYEVLGDSAKRKSYERLGKRGIGRDSSGEDEEYDEFFTSRRGRQDPFGGMRHARDIFESFFGGEDPFESFFNHGRSRGGRPSRRTDPFGFGSFGMMNMDSMFDDDDAFFSNMGMNSSMMRMHSSSSGFSGQIGGGVSTKVSSSTYVDSSGRKVMKKTTETTGSDGKTKRVTEEYVNGKLIQSNQSAQLEQDQHRPRLQDRRR